MGKATLFVLVAAAAGLLVYLLAAPKFVHPHPDTQLPTAPVSNTSRASQPDHLPDASSTGLPANPPGGNSNSTSNGGPVNRNDGRIEVPVSSEQRAAQEREARRGPLYDWIRANMPGMVVGYQPSKADPATLDLYMAKRDASDITVCMNRIVQPYADKYGFNHVQFYVPAPESESSGWHLDSEATPDTDGVWHLFKK